jgi:predicted NAD/FAD-binding protein
LRIAVVGSGVAGLGAAHLLSQQHGVDLFEAEQVLGGHAHTVDIVVDETPLTADVGFMVFNHVTYPNLVGMFERFSVPEQDAEMTFSVHCDDPGVEWKGQDLNTFFAQRSNLVSASHWGLLFDIVRLSTLADRYRDDAALRDVTLGEFLKREHFGRGFTERYVVPMVSAIWSAPPGKMLDFPAATFVRFFDNHRMLRVTDLVDITEGAHWRSVPGGSRRYVEKLAAEVSGDTFTGTPVQRVTRTDDGVVLTLPDGTARSYDQVVMATHGEPTLGLLEDPTGHEREVLGAFPYQPNRCVLHTDESFLPKRELARAAWNYYAAECRLDSTELSVTYYLNKLQRLAVPTPVMVTVNPPHEVDPAHVLAEFAFEHPLFDQAALAAQSRIPDIQGIDRIWYAGAWQRYGFHEDGLWSAVRVAEGFGIPAPWSKDVEAMTEHAVAAALAPSPSPEAD